METKNRSHPPASAERPRRVKPKRKPWDIDVRISPEILAAQSGKALFYPCSGMDYWEPLALFAPWVQDFYFVDKAYFCPGDQDMRERPMGQSVYRLNPRLLEHPDYQIREVRISGDGESHTDYRPDYSEERIDPLTDSRWIVPPVLRTEIYTHLPSGREIRVHFWRNDGVTALLSLATTIDLGVFFYRGDSMGEGGSGVMWMQLRLISLVLFLLADQGLVVTDGSQHHGMGWAQDRGIAYGYQDFWRDQSWSRHREGFQAGGPTQVGHTFEDETGRVLRCVGEAGSGYGRTLAWQVDKANWEPRRDLGEVEVYLRKILEPAESDLLLGLRPKLALSLAVEQFAAAQKNRKEKV
jgi:hypothetical protein